MIDQKLEELEATGLTREEVLYDNPTHAGLPLSQDPFFQYIKNNHIAREALLKPGEEFTVQKIIDLALRQDIGSDPGQSAAKLKNRRTYHASKMGLPSARKNPKAFDSTTYSGASSSSHQHYLQELVSKLQNDQSKLIKQEVQTKPDRKYHEVPQTKSEIRKQNLRKINYFDIHWRNTELITQFVNTSGLIKNKLQNRLTKPQQKKIASAIRLSREMLLMPYSGYIKPSDKKSLTTLQEDVENTIRSAINIETGHVYIKGQVNEHRNVMEEHEKLNEDFDAERVETSKDYTVSGTGQFLKNSDEFSLLEARMHAAQLKEKQLKDIGVDTQSIREKYQKKSHNQLLTNENVVHQQYYVYPPEFEQLPKQNQEVYSKAFQVYQDKIKELPADKFASLLIHEKATDATDFKSKIKDSDLSFEESLEFVNYIRSRGGITNPLKI